jgi:hypothetical protein
MPDTTVFFPIFILNENIILTNVLLQIRSTVYSAYEKKKKKNEERIINASETRCWRRMSKIKWTDRIMKDEVFQRVKKERLLLKS